MNKNEILPNVFFDISGPLFSALFDSQNEPWKILDGRLKAYLKEVTQDKLTIKGKVSTSAHLEGDSIFIAEDAEIEPGAYVKGPVYIGPKTVVRHGAYIRGNVLIGSNCVIGNSTEIKHSVLFNGAKAGHFNYIGDSILGNNVNLGAGTKLANLKIREGNVVLRIEGQNIDSGLKKFGSILGDDCQTGCNSVLNPGTVLAPKSLVYPCAAVSGVHLKRAVLKG